MFETSHISTMLDEEFLARLQPVGTLDFDLIYAIVDRLEEILDRLIAAQNVVPAMNELLLSETLEVIRSNHTMTQTEFRARISNLRTRSQLLEEQKRKTDEEIREVWSRVRAWQTAQLVVGINQALAQTIDPSSMDTSREGRWEFVIPGSRPQLAEKIRLHLIKTLELPINDENLWKFTVEASEFEEAVGEITVKAREITAGVRVGLGITYDVVVEWNGDDGVLKMSGMFGIKRWQVGRGVDKTREIRFLRFERY